MHAYIITYDLDSADQSNVHYEEVAEAIRLLGTAAQVQFSVWVAASKRETCEDVRTYLKTVLKSGDRLFVGRLSAYASRNNREGVSQIFDRAWPD